MSQELKNVYKGQLTINDIVASAKQEIKQILSQNIDVSNEIENAKEVIGSVHSVISLSMKIKNVMVAVDIKMAVSLLFGNKFVKNITKTDAQDLLNPKKYMTKKKKGLKSKMENI